MVRTQISLEEEMYEAARREAERLGISFAELCRRSLAHQLAQADKAATPWMELAGSIEGGDERSSLSVDEVVYGRERP
jgi:hypothetical protein